MSLRSSVRQILLSKSSAAINNNWTPIQLSPDLWFSAADSSSITLVSSAVSQWADKSGFGRNLVQATNTNRPIVNGGIEFDGIDDELTTGSTFTISTTINSFFLVEKNLNGSVGAAPCSFSASTPNSGIIFQNNGGLQPFKGILVLPYNQTIGRMILYTQGINSGYVNGDDVLIMNTSTGAYTSSDFSVGRRILGNIYTSGTIYEIVVFAGNLSIGNIDKLFGYAAWLYGLQSLLRSNHPYKNSPPTL